MTYLDRDAVIDDLVLEEGYRASVYKDHLGFYTIGIGTCIDAKRACGITFEQAKRLAEDKIIEIEKELYQRALWWQGESSNRRRALVLMAYQLGVSGLLNFKKMTWAMQHGDYKQAYKEALDSNWARQTPERAKRVAKLILEG